MASTFVKSLRISPELWLWVNERADKRQISANAWVVRCIEDAKQRLEDVPASGPAFSRPPPGSRLKGSKS